MEKRHILRLLVFLTIIVIGVPTVLSVPDYLTTIQPVCTADYVGSGGVSRNNCGTLVENQPDNDMDSVVTFQTISHEDVIRSPTAHSVRSTHITGKKWRHVSTPDSTPVSTPVSTPDYTTSVTSVSTILSTPVSVNGTNKTVQVYYDGAQSASYTNIRYDLVTDVLWAFIRIDGDGNLDYSDYGDPSEVISLAHSKGKRVILSFQEVYGQADIMLGNPTARTNAINNLLNEVKMKGFDGVDNDIETSTYFRQDGMTSFIQELYNKFKQSNPNYRISLAVPITDWNDVFNGPIIKDYIDYIMIMAYFWDDNNPISGPMEPMLQDDTSEVSVSTGINYWKNIEQIPANKILLGIPYYGFDRETTSNARLAYKSGTVQWVYIDDFPSYNYDRYFDSLWKTPWQAWQEGNQWHQLQYEDIESLTYKYDRVNSEGLAGIGVWAINYGSNRQDLWQLIKDKFVG